MSAQRERSERDDARARRAPARLRAGHARPSRRGSAAVDPATGDAETVVDALAGLPLNSPNDVVVKRDGTIWFTDPSYGYLQGFRPEPAHGDFVYRYDPDARPADGRRVRLRQAERARLLAGRERALRRRQRREPRAGQLRPAAAAPHPRLRRRRRPARERPPVRGHDAGLPGRDQGRRRRARLRLVVQRGAGLRPRRRAHRRDPPPGRRQLHLRRRRAQRPLHHHGHGRLGRGPRTRKERDRHDGRPHPQDHRRRRRRRGDRRRARAGQRRTATAS